MSTIFGSIRAVPFHPNGRSIGSLRLSLLLLFLSRLCPKVLKANTVAYEFSPGSAVPGPSFESHYSLLSPSRSDTNLSGALD